MKSRVVTMVDRVETILRRRREGATSGLIFPVRNDQKGGALTAAAFSQRFRRLVARAEKKGLLARTKAGEAITPYTLRHSRLSSLCGQGLPVAFLMQEAGHTNYNTTKRYVHLSATEVAEAVRRLDGGEPRPHSAEEATGR
jgi:site-specific recombinase XerD